MRITALMEQCWHNLRYGVRLLRRSPGFTVTATLILTLAIGANTAIFSVIEAVLLRPWPYRDAQRLCVLWKTVPKRNIEWDWTSYPTIRDWRDRNDVFADLAAVLRPEGSTVMLAAMAPEKIQASKVSGNFFDILGVRPLVGRTFSSGEEHRGDAVAVLSYGFWRRRFNRSESGLGRTIRIDDRSTTIIGVMPPSFQFPDKNAQLWLLLTADSRWHAFQRFRIADAFCAIGPLAALISAAYWLPAASLGNRNSPCAPPSALVEGACYGN